MKFLYHWLCLLSKFMSKNTIVCNYQMHCQWVTSLDMWPCSQCEEPKDGKERQRHRVWERVLISTHQISSAGRKGNTKWYLKYFINVNICNSTSYSFFSLPPSLYHSSDCGIRCSEFLSFCLLVNFTQSYIQEIFEDCPKSRWVCQGSPSKCGLIFCCLEWIYSLKVLKNSIKP